MIVGLRSVLLCNEVRETPQGADYIGLHGDPIVLETEPGICQLWVTMQLELDRRPTSGQFRLHCDGYDKTLPFGLREGFWLTGVAFPALIILNRSGPLWLTIVDDAKPARPFKLKWLVDLAPDARHVPDDVLRQAREASDETARIMAASFAAQAGGSRQ